MSIPSGTASIDQLYKWLVELSLQVRQPEHVSVRIDDALKIYADKLTAYPSERVMLVLSEWPERHSYWPTWNELKEVLAAGRHRQVPDLTIYAGEDYPT